MANGTATADAPETFTNVTPVEAPETFSNVAPVAGQATEEPGFLSKAWDKAVSMFPSKDEALRALGGSGVTAYHLATNPKEAFLKLAQESPGFAQAQEYLRSRETGSSVPRSILNTAGTLVGVDPAAQEAAAARGDTAGVAADAAVPAAVALAGYGAHLGAPKIGAAISDVATSFKPQLMAGADALQHPTELPGRAVKAALNAIPDSPEVAAEKQLKADAAAMRTRNLQARVAESKAADTAGQTVQEYRAAQKAAAKAAVPAAPEVSPIITSQSPEIPSEGRPATWRNLSVSDLASKGGPLTFDAAKQAQLRQLDVPNVGMVADPHATVGADAIGSSADRLAMLREIAGYPSLKGGPGDFTTGRNISLSAGEDLGPGLGTEHTIHKADGTRIGSVTVEPKGDGVLHVHWLGGDLAGNASRADIIDSIKKEYPGTEKITYDRRRLAKGADAATTEPREMTVSGS